MALGFITPRLALYLDQMLLQNLESHFCETFLTPPLPPQAELSAPSLSPCNPHPYPPRAPTELSAQLESDAQGRPGVGFPPLPSDSALCAG